MFCMSRMNVVTQNCVDQRVLQMGAIGRGVDALNLTPWSSKWFAQRSAFRHRRTWLKWQSQNLGWLSILWQHTELLLEKHSSNKRKCQEFQDYNSLSGGSEEAKSWFGDRIQERWRHEATGVVCVSQFHEPGAQLCLSSCVNGRATLDECALRDFVRCFSFKRKSWRLPDWVYDFKWKWRPRELAEDVDKVNRSMSTH